MLVVLPEVLFVYPNFLATKQSKPFLEFSNFLCLFGSCLNALHVRLPFTGGLLSHPVDSAADLLSGSTNAGGQSQARVCLWGKSRNSATCVDRWSRYSYTAFDRGLLCSSPSDQATRS